MWVSGVILSTLQFVVRGFCPGGFCLGDYVLGEFCSGGGRVGVTSVPPPISPPVSISCI